MESEDGPGTAGEWYLELLKRCCPDFGAEIFEVDEIGWDNTVLKIGGRFILRIPRREDCAARIEKEVSFLGKVSQMPPLPVPKYTRICRDMGKVLSAGYSMLPGSLMAGNDVAGRWNRELPGGESEASDIAAWSIASFLRVLHSIAPELASDSGADMVDPAENLRNLGPYAEEVRKSLYPYLAGNCRETLDSIFSEFSGNTGIQAHTPTVIHNDLERGNILWNPGTGQITGIIDWGDMEIGDPARDLQGCTMSTENALETVFFQSMAATMAPSGKGPFSTES